MCMCVCVCDGIISQFFFLLSSQKGFRYQLHCSAKAASIPMCVVWCQGGGNPKSELSSRFEAPNESNRWDRPLIIARRLIGDKMELDWDRLDQVISDKPMAPPNQGTVPEPRSLMLNTDAAIASVIQNVLQAQKDGGKLLLPRHATLAELRTWKRDYLSLLDPEKADVAKSFLQFCVVKCKE